MTVPNRLALTKSKTYIFCRHSRSEKRYQEQSAHTTKPATENQIILVRDVEYNLLPIYDFIILLSARIPVVVKNKPRNLGR
jgi:hypothetical protein